VSAIASVVVGASVAALSCAASVVVDESPASSVGGTVVLSSELQANKAADIRPKEAAAAAPFILHPVFFISWLSSTINDIN
jgi:hypothetical protein